FSSSYRCFLLVSHGVHLHLHSFPTRRSSDLELLASKPAVPRLVWLGHASFMLRYGEHTVLTDPVFSHRASPFKHFGPARSTPVRSEEHTSELQSRFDLVCRLLLEKKK